MAQTHTLSLSLPLDLCASGSGWLCQQLEFLWPGGGERCACASAGLCPDTCAVLAEPEHGPGCGGGACVWEFFAIKGDPAASR